MKTFILTEFLKPAALYPNPLLSMSLKPSGIIFLCCHSTTPPAARQVSLFHYRLLHTKAVILYSEAFVVFMIYSLELKNVSFFYWPRKPSLDGQRNSIEIS